MPSLRQETYRFGQFELDLSAGELRRNAARVRVQPQPFKLLALLVRRAGALVGREEIRSELWPDGTFVDFDQSVNFAVRQIRDVLGDSAERPLYIETVPRRGYRFIAPVDGPGLAMPAGAPQQPSPAAGSATTVRLQKALWANIADLRLAEERRRRTTKIALIALSVLLAAIVTYVLIVQR